LAIPTPEPGLVLNYAYLWHDEFRNGREEGRKNRPTVIVLCSTQAEDQSTIVTVLPITYAAPTHLRAKLRRGGQDQTWFNLLA
jgi:hypothetical protein